MGIHPASSYANIYLARRIDKQIEDIGRKYNQNYKNAFLLFKRFLDDILKFLGGTTKELHNMLDEINQIHPLLKFTMNHTTPPSEAQEDRCDCVPQISIPFLDMSISIENGRIETDLFKKDTDRNQYLLRESCHPKGVTASIPFSLGLRINRVCSKKEYRDKRLEELTTVLLKRGYPEELVKRGIEKARKVHGLKALSKVKKKTDQNRPVLTINVDPRLPAKTTNTIKTLEINDLGRLTLKKKFLRSPFYCF